MKAIPYNFRELYESGLTYSKLTKEFKVCTSTIRTWIDQLGLIHRQSCIGKNTYETPNLNDLKKSYEIDKKTTTELGETHNVSVAVIIRWLKLSGATMRSGGHIKGTPLAPGVMEKVRAATTGLKRSKETCQKISNSKKGDKNPNFGKKCSSSGKRCWYTLPSGRVVSMRSRWEVWYAEHLKENRIEFDYEPITFLLKNGSAYTPDFYLNDSKEYIEVKGWLTAEHKSRLSMFREEYPQHKLVFADKTYLESLGIDLRKKWISEKPLFECELCQKQFHRTYPQQRFCSVKCRNKNNATITKKNFDSTAKPKRIYKGCQSGEFNNSSKIDEETAILIIDSRKKGMKYSEIAKTTGASQGNISNILSGRSWKHLTR